jgi:hypothetical protein
VAGAKAAVFVAGGQIDEWKYGNLWSPTLIIFLDEPVRIAKAITRLVSRTVWADN